MTLSPFRLPGIPKDRSQQQIRGPGEPGIWHASVGDNSENRKGQCPNSRCPMWDTGNTSPRATMQAFCFPLCMSESLVPPSFPPPPWM